MVGETSPFPLHPHPPWVMVRQGEAGWGGSLVQACMCGDHQGSIPQLFLPPGSYFGKTAFLQQWPA